MRAVTRRLALPLGLAATAVMMVAPVPAAERLDLSEAYQMAMERDPEIRAADARLRASDELDVQSRSLFLPQVELEAGASRIREDLVDPERDPTYNNAWNASINVTQPLFRKDNFAIADRNEILQDQAGLEFARAKQDLLLEVSRAYFDLLLAQDTLRLTNAELEAVESELERAERALEVGTGTVTDRNEARARFDQVRADRVQARNQVQIARRTLRSLIGEEPGELAGLREGFEAQSPSPASAEQWAQRAESQNLDVQLADSEFRRARTEIRREQGERYPEVDLVASHGRNYQGGGTVTSGTNRSFETDETRIGVQVSMPLYTGGRNASQVREARAERDASFQDSVEAKRQASLEGESAYLNLVSSLRRIRALEQARESARSTERSTRRGLEVGLRTTVDVLNAQSERFSTERDLAEARYDYLVNYLELQVAVGSGVEGSIVDDVNFFLANSEQAERDIDALAEPQPAEESGQERGGE